MNALTNAAIAVLVIGGFVAYSGHAQPGDKPAANQSLPACENIVYDGSPFTCHYDGDLPGVPPIVNSVPETVVAKQGPSADGACWTLVVREIDRPEYHGTHCVPQAVYDRYSVGSTFNG